MLLTEFTNKAYTHETRGPLTYEYVYNQSVVRDTMEEMIAINYKKGPLCQFPSNSSSIITVSRWTFVYKMHSNLYQDRDYAKSMSAKGHYDL